MSATRSVFHRAMAQVLSVVLSLQGVFVWAPITAKAAGDGTVDSTVEINDTTTNGPALANSDNYGYGVAGIGDLDRDGVEDVAVGAYLDDTSGTGRGALHISYLNTNGTVDSTVKIDDTTTNGPTLANDDAYGYNVVSIGDLNNDGVQDLLVSAIGDDTGGSDRGAVYIHFMNTNGSIDSSVELNDSTTNGAALSDGDMYGWGIASIGDLNRDGVGDIAVGAYFDDEGGNNRGTVHIHYMNTDGTIDSTVEINDSTTNGPVLADADYFGSSIAAIGDLNNDGVTELAVGAEGDDTDGNLRGAVYILYMNTNGSLDSTVKIDDSTTNGPVLADGSEFGWAVAAIGDVNGDGVEDLGVSAVADSTEGSYRGAIFLVYLNTDGSVDSVSKISSSTTNGPTLSDDDYFGSGLSSLGDLNGDGVIDLAVGASYDDAGGGDRGALHILFLGGAPLGTMEPASTVKIDDSTTNGPALADGDLYGGNVVSLGDLNNDGVDDIAVGAAYDNTGGAYRGAVHIHFMNTDGSIDSTAVINDSTTNGPVLADDDYYGYGIAAIGDLNNDGVGDIAVGALGDDTGGTDRGAVYISFLNTDGTVDSTVTIDDATTNGPVLGNDSYYGSGVAFLGDLNDDGVGDIAVGAYNDDGDGTDEGAVYISFMNTDGTVDSTVKIDDSTANGPVIATNDLYGDKLAAIGDLNNDGVEDLAVGANGNDTGGTDRGAVHIHFLNTDGSIDSTVQIDDSTTNGPVLSDSDAYGAGIVLLGDLNQDGVNDLAIGASGDDEGGSSRGAAHIHFMNADGSIDSTLEVNDTTTSGPVLADDDQYGYGIGAVGDLNNDGVIDIAIGALGDDTGGTDRGAVHITFLQEVGVTPTNDPTLDNVITASRLKAGASSTYDFGFTLQNTISGTLTITFPAGFTVTAAATSGACTGGTVDTFGFTAQTLTAVKTGCTAGALTLSGATVTNHSTPGAYTVSWVNDDPGEGVIYIIDDDQVTVTGNVDPSLTFNAGMQDDATACDGTFSGNGGTLALGVLTTGAVTTSDASSVDHICTRLSTNASGGASVTVRSLNGTDGLKSTSVPADTIPSSTATLVAGTAGYGLCTGSAGGDSGNDAISGAASPTRSSPFDTTCTNAAHNVGGLTTSAQNLWTLSGPSQNAFVRTYVKAAISGTTAAHADYSDTLTFIGTGTF